MASDKMDRGLDEIIADKRSNGSRTRRGGDRRRDRQDYPRDGVKKVRVVVPFAGFQLVREADSPLGQRLKLSPSSPSSESSGTRLRQLLCALLRSIDFRSFLPIRDWILRYDFLANQLFGRPRSLSVTSLETWIAYRNRGPAPRRRRESPSGGDARGARLRVENIHYDLTEEDLDELFRRIGPITKLQLRYDRSGRSEGVAFVTYESKDDAAEAVRQFDGANANGQPIRLSIMSSGPSRNPFDTAVMPGKPLSERISAPGGRSRSLSPRRYDEEDAARRGIDRYVPGGSRSRSPMPPRRGGGGGGRRPGARREGGGRDQDAARGGRGGRGNGGNGGSDRAARTNTPRLKKTQEELDAEMEDYFNANGGAPEPAAEVAAAPSGQATAPANADDIDMIE
ncbi:THO complex subunit 4A [Trichoderma lentiforme]|uniref:THO complex subunit 4A n=1 Tax=Trichoderma lentiforme TaxID=1567552 RepID=A0A9P4XNE6_9HYPO|nr:THO complex subunit 4A [Trichoderma lentiforme]